ncbi:MAG: (2Fe-2S) ferredoxin domain-containing protein [Alphaproteobacteria bacterium]|nr:(2Fe-2S) ferredoxin domain-containing protein [Alphaproteobacteria bacterium]
MPPSFDFHFFICQNERPAKHPRGCCLSKGSDKLLNYMKARVKELGIQNIRINKAGCMDQCEKGPAMVVYPEGVWYSPKTSEDVDEIINSHILKKCPPKRLLME